MKKQFLLLAGSALILASCGSNNEPPAQTQAQIDSAVNAKLAEHDAENAAKNDSILRAMEAEKAAALAKETESKTTTTTKTKSNGSKKTTTKTETKTTEPVPPPPPPPGGMRGHADQATPPAGGAKSTGGGMRGHADPK